jgi:hypothetical protein
MYLIWKFERYLVCSSIGILVKLQSKNPYSPIKIFDRGIWRFLIGVWLIYRSNSYQIFWSDFNIKSDQQNIKCLVGKYVWCVLNFTIVILSSSWWSWTWQVRVGDKSSLRTIYRAFNKDEFHHTTMLRGQEFLQSIISCYDLLH